MALFTDRDILEVFSAISIYNNVFKTNYINELRRKIILLNPESVELMKNITEDHFVVDLFEEQICVETEVGEEIRKALAIQSILKIKLRGQKNARAIKLFPIAYVLKKDGLYLYGFYEEYQLIFVESIKSVTHQIIKEHIISKKYCEERYRDEKIRH